MKYTVCGESGIEYKRTLRRSLYNLGALNSEELEFLEEYKDD